ncbi:MAG: GHKL domain-containing protein [Clostridiales bacterium]|nr:GHKL domain-containing protein [Clostridiales bacterium]
MTESIFTILLQGFLEAITNVMIASTINKEIKLSPPRLLLYAVILAALSLFMSTVQIPFHTAVTIPATALIYLLIKWPTRRTVLNYLIDIVMAIFILSFLQMVISIIASGMDINLMENSIARLIIIVIIILIFFILSSRTRIHVFFERYYFPFRNIVILAIISLMFMNIIFNDLFLYNSEELTSSMSFYVLTIVIGYFIASAFIGAALFSAIRSTQKSKVVLKYGEHQSNIINEYRIKTHDFNNSIHTIKALNKNEDGSICCERIEEYLKTIDDMKNKKDDLTIINDDVFISAVLYTKQEYAKENHIDFHVSGLNTLAEYRISDTDLLEILNNLIDNAFEEVGKLSSKNRIVFIEFNENSIDVVNSVSTNSTEKNVDMFFDQGFTTKGAGRGSGLAKVRSIAESNNILINTFWKNGMIVFRLQFTECVKDERWNH